jgi:hypothetical protein
MNYYNMNSCILILLFFADFQSKLRNLFTSTLEKYKLMEKKYDDETNHSVNNAEQEKWNQQIKALLDI